MTSRTRVVNQDMVVTPRIGPVDLRMRLILVKEIEVEEVVQEQPRFEVGTGKLVDKKNELRAKEGAIDAMRRKSRAQTLKEFGPAES